MDLTPAELGRAFATEVLDWPEVDISTDSRFTEPGDTVVTMTAPDDRFVALLVRDDAGGKVIVRVGAPELYGPHLVYTSRGGNYEWRLAPGSMLHDLPLGISQASAVRVARADVQVRSLDGDVIGPVEVILASEGNPALADGLGDAERIASGLVLYRDTEGEVIGAGGGTFAEGEPLALSPTPSEIRADGHVTQPELWSAVASVVRCVGSTGVEASGSINLDGEFSFTVESEPGAEPASGGFRPCVAEHLGSVEVAVAFQRTPPGHTESAFYNAVLECVENETGLEFPDVSEPAPERPTSAAIAAAPRVYDACFDDVVAVHPTRLFGSG